MPSLLSRESADARLRLALDAAGVGTWDLDLVAGHLAWDEAHHRILGFAPGTFSGRPEDFFARVHPADRGALEAAMERARDTRAEFRAGFRVTRPDGAARWLEGRGVFLYDEAGTPVRATGITRDVTDERERGAALRRSEALFRGLATATPNGVFHADPAGRVTYANPQGAQLWEEAEGRVMGRGWLRRVHPHDRDTLLRRWAAANRRGREFGGSFRLVLPDGGVRWVRVRSNALRDASGRCVGIVGTAEDVTRERAALAALHESESRYRGFVEQSPLPVLAYDAEGRMVEANPAARRLWGGGPEQLGPGYTVWGDAQLAASGVLDHFRRAYAGAAVTVAPSMYDLSALVPGGARIWVRAHLFPVRDAEGELRQVMVVQEDVTARVEADAERERWADSLARANARLQEQTAALEERTAELEATVEALDASNRAARSSEARFRAAMDAMPGGIAIFDPADASLLLFNDNAAAGLGYTRDEFARLRASDFAAVYTHADVLATMERAAASPDGVRFTARQRTRTGEERDVVVGLRGLEMDGRSVILGMWVDITGQRRSEEEARTQRELLDTVLGNIPLMVGVFDDRGRLLYANRDWERVLGWSTEDSRRMDLLAEVYPDPAYRAEVAAFMADPTGEWRTFATRVRDGRVVPTSWTNVRLPDGRYIGIGKDVSAEVAGEARRGELEAQLQQAQKMEAVGRLAGGIAHDFNNLLMVIGGFAALLEHAPAGSGGAYLAEIRRATERATALTQQLLAFGRKQALKPRVLDLAAVVEGAGAMLRRLVREDVEMVFRLEPRVWPTRADPHQVEQVLVNLVVNARDAARGGGAVEVSVANRAVAAGEPVPAGRYVALTVRDTGCGMDAATLAQVFEPFFTTKAVGEGTGLGLSTVYGIVNQSGGHVWAESEPGRGSAFHVLLPALPLEPGAPDAPEASGEMVRGTGVVLLVEDDAVVRGLVRRVLANAGYTVLEAGDGEAALRAAEHAGSVDLVLTDAVMPRMSGPELVRRLREERPDLPVLMMSGYAGDALARGGPLPEGTILLQKPLDPAELLRRVHAALG